jgi:hypothetical protein
MFTKATIGLCAGLFALVAVPLSGTAQTAPADKAHRQIGVPSNAKSETIPSLIVLNARGASLQGSILTLLGVASNAIIFADRPVRAAGHALTTDLLQEWSSGDEEKNWVQTRLGKGYNIALHLYGPLEPWFNQTWRPGDVELQP